MPVSYETSLPVGPEWGYEFHWGGERILAFKQRGGVRLVSVGARRDLTNRFPAIAAHVARLPAATVVMEAVVRALDGRQLRVLAGDAAPPPTAIRLIATDLLWLGDGDVRPLPLRERKDQLGGLVRDTALLLSRLETRAADEMRIEAQRCGADGVMAKRLDSAYRPFARAGDWLAVSHAPGAARRNRLRAPAGQASRQFDGRGHAVGARR